MLKTDLGNLNSSRLSRRLPRPLWLRVMAVAFGVGTASVPFGGLLSCRQSVDGEESPTGKGPAAAPRDEPVGAQKQTREISRVIDALASRNKAPIQRGKKGDLELEYPDDYDKEADAVVNSAGDQLIAQGTAAFPLLIEHFQDERFSHVIDTPGGETIAPVGLACQSIVACQLEVYKKVGIHPWMVPSYFWDVVEEDEKPDEWWKSHQAKSLYELQLEAVEWAVARLKRIVQAGEYRGVRIGPDDLAEVIAVNERKLEELRKSGQPTAAKRAFPTRYK